MTKSKEWDWEQVHDDYWLQPCEESYYLADRWLGAGYRSVLDLGCGLGRHSIFFAKRGFDVYAMDLSVQGTEHLREWAGRERVAIDIRVGDMLALPYGDGSFDCVFAYHVISHTDTAGIRVILGELNRVLKTNGEFYLTLCSKESWDYKEAGYPCLDENTVVKTDEGPEMGIPHFYADLDDILRLFQCFSLSRVRHTNDCLFEGKRQDRRHYFILGKKL